MTKAEANNPAVIKVQVIRAWPQRHDSRQVEVPEGATVAEAIATAGIPTTGIAGVAIFGERVHAQQVLRDGDRVELLDPLRIDPKHARRVRARGGASRS